MTSQIGKQIITIQILPNTSKKKTIRQEIWSVNRKKYEKYFSTKIMQKRQGD